MAKSIEECRAQFGRVWSVEAGEHTVVFTKPNYAQWRKYKSDFLGGITSQEPSQSIDADEALCKPPTGVVVSHTPEELERVAEDWGDVYEVVSAEVKKLQAKKESARVKEWKVSSPK